MFEIVSSYTNGRFSMLYVPDRRTKNVVYTDALR